MFSFLLILALQTTSELNAGELATYQSSLSSAAREELSLVDKIRALRISVERLDERWTASGLKSQPGLSTMNKQILLLEVEAMELQSAERWNIIVHNTAYLDRLTDPKAFEARKELSGLPKTQADLKKRIEEVILKIRDGELLNLASQVVLH